jgi:hypothetical protein
MLFDLLWNNHPTITDDNFPCSSDGKPNFENQCAIRMGECLQRSGFDVGAPPVRRCWFHTGVSSHILAAEELAKALESNASYPGIRPPIKFHGDSGFDAISGKKGIIFFKDYYGPGGQGDHIDLWNGSRLTRFSSLWDFLIRDGGRYQKAEVWLFEVVGSATKRVA